MPNCIHGFPDGECLICRTLGTGPAKGKATRTKVASPPELATLLAPSRGGPMVAARQPSTPPVPERAGKRRRFWPVVGAVVVGVVVVWVVAGIFSLALHIAEYVALALVAGWVGYRIGRARGRRHP